MASDRFRVARIGELPEIPVPDAGIVWRPVRRTLGITAFGVNAYTADPGEDVVEKHSEERLGHEEMYVVISGRATFELDGESIDGPPGTIVFVADPKVLRHAVAQESGTTVLAVGGRPGLHETSAWEYFFAAYAHAEKEEYDEAIAEIERGLAELADHPALHYHLACIECRADRLDEAAGHLQQALELDESLRRWAEEDEDLAPIRERLGIAG